MTRKMSTGKLGVWGTETYKIPNAPVKAKKSPATCYTCGKTAKKGSELEELVNGGWIFVRKGQVDQLVPGPIVALCRDCHVL